MRRGEEAMVPEAEFRSYYGQPIIKVPIWHEPHMPLYLYLGGTSGAASVISAVATVTGHDRLALTARVTAAAGAAAGAGFLVAELGRPERFLNMLRVFKPTSPMSVGSWLLAAHSGLTALAAASALAARPGPRIPAGSFLRAPARSGLWVPARSFSRIPVRPGPRTPVLPVRGARALAALGDAAALAAVVTGPLMSTYTAVLVADTAVPAWHEAHRELPFLFAGSALAGAGAVGMLATPRREAGPARVTAILGAAVETVAGAVMEHRLGLVGEPYRLGRSGRLMRTARALTVGGALLATVAGRDSALGALTALSGLALTAGAVCTRFGVLAAGKASAADPKYTVVPQRERLEAGRAARVPAGEKS
ncbi:NrfD/PsrC family molybdoenzyme membrane anchor subunit [Streptosporangium sp. NPDC023825]|uniref:NrfD/PsrC family molybdoenzyme membrane anchor subunit n=1 Tax=Streptosporangium sp. NPDC023825 TaxID=3154909 RepID=UPI00344558CE